MASSQNGAPSLTISLLQIVCHFRALRLRKKFEASPESWMPSKSAQRKPAFKALMHRKPFNCAWTGTESLGTAVSRHAINYCKRPAAKSGLVAQTRSIDTAGLSLCAKRRGAKKFDSS
jgi:hypothetical protein